MIFASLQHIKKTTHPHLLYRKAFFPPTICHISIYRSLEYRLLPFVQKHNSQTTAIILKLMFSQTLSIKHATLLKEIQLSYLEHLELLISTKPSYVGGPITLIKAFPSIGGGSTLLFLPHLSWVIVSIVFHMSYWSNLKH